jgi:S1-C subfamily serine protease
MGNGHVEYGHGVRHQLRDLGVTNVGMLIPVDASIDCGEVKPGFADAVYALPEVPREEPPRPRLGVHLQPSPEGVTLVDVTPGSLAESTGLRKGDVIVSLAGGKITRLEAVIAAVRAQPEGTWLPIQVQRDGKTLDLVIKFPPKQ